MTGPVALDIHFQAARKNPTAIHRVTKWALDALEGTVVDGPRAHRRALLYRNDRQVKLLHVHLQQTWDSEGDLTEPESGISRIMARPVRDVVEDLRVFHRLDDDGDHDDDSGDEDFDDDPFSIMAPVFGDPEMRRVASAINDWNLFRLRERTQRVLLDSADHLISNALRAAPHRIAGARRPRDPATDGEAWQLLHRAMRHRDIGWDHLLSGPLTIPMPGLPSASGERSQFRDEVRRQLEEFRRHHRALDPLVVPLKITILVVPPEQGKDLDNIALDVLPTAHEVLKPHVEPWLLAPTFGEIGEHREKALRRMRSINAQSVTTYQVIELQRIPEDPKAGLLRLVLGRGDQYDSFWTETYDLVRKRLSRI
ncbi:hypothetical protein ACIA8B_22850 [Micromonospora chalcea]